MNSKLAQRPLGLRTFCWSAAFLVVALAESAPLFAAPETPPVFPKAAGGGESNPSGSTSLGIQGPRFTLNGQPAFLFGLSYYGGLGAPETLLQQDLADMKRYGFNWIRVWATWGSMSNNVSAVDSTGNPREPFLARLKHLLEECDRRAMIVDVTLSRGDGVSGQAGIQTLAAHRRAVETLVMALKTYRNWYLDLANERNVRDKRFVSFSELKELRESVWRLDRDRLVTASHGGDISLDVLKEYLEEARVDFISPHRPRDRESPAQTHAKTLQYLGWITDIGRSTPVHYQEPFRRGYGKWQPLAADYITDARNALRGGAAGWCFHNGDERSRQDKQPRRSFDLRQTRLFEQLDSEERKALELLTGLLRGHRGN